ncbi:MAG: hypothetical protein GVY33_15635 [Alphaproteobacteria bacterium]|nr:hypothetical protein [Alphaproteobacteria bacterium]
MSFFLLFGAIALGLGTAGVAMLAWRVTGRRAPRWAPPLAGGLAMMSFYVWMEYAWFQRVSNQLSERVVVVETHSRSVWWQPWSLLRPQVVRFSAIDRASVEPVGRELVRLELWLVDRYTGSAQVSQIYDCSEPRRLDVAADTRFDDAGRPVDGDWRRVPPAEPHRRVACRLAERPVDDAVVPG